jgi:hypothetical protein
MSMREVGTCGNDPCRQLDLLWEGRLLLRWLPGAGNRLRGARLHRRWGLRHRRPG